MRAVIEHEHRCAEHEHRCAEHEHRCAEHDGPFAASLREDMQLSWNATLYNALWIAAALNGVLRLSRFCELEKLPNSLSDWVT
ncbi:MAG: hypothetical protein RLY14_1481 [Planctomycetota bacterium]|jgi:hypothetical protein